MLRIAIALRLVMLVASLGAALGAIVMFWQGAEKVLSAAHSIFVREDSRTIVTSVMGGTDAFLFGIVLVIFAYAIAFGFVFDLTADQRNILPAWMRPVGIGELKETLISVLLVYLVVDFATDWPQSDAGVDWQVLTKPISIFLIAAALRLRRTGLDSDVDKRDGMRAG